MSMPEIKPPICPVKRCQAVSDLIESVALIEAGISHIVNAEGEKIQKVIKYDTNEDICIDDVIKVNDSVRKMVCAISKLEMVLHSKLELAVELDEIY